MPKYMITPFAVSGAKTAIPEVSQADGSLSYPQGYPQNYERDLETDPLALPIERAKFNQLMFDITDNLQDYQVYCLPPFITDGRNNGQVYAYPLFGVCRYDDGSGMKGYISTVADNTSVPSVGGATQAGWAKILDPQNNIVFKNDFATNIIYGIMRFATDAEAAQGILNNVAVTPAQLLKARSQTGDEKTWRGPIAPGGWLFLRGQVLSRATYADLYDFAVSNQMITTDADWQANRKWGLYSHGDGAGTFRLPNMQGMYLCGFEASYHQALGEYSQDQIVNIEGSWSGNAFYTTGAFYDAGYGPLAYDGRSNGRTQAFSADRVVNTGERVQPRTIPVNWIVKY